MTAPFAALEARVNTAIIGKLSNVSVEIDYQEPVYGIFESQYQAAETGYVSSSQPAVKVSSAAVPNMPVGISVMVIDIAYKVAAAEPDGTGMTRLILELA